MYLSFIFMMSFTEAVPVFGISFGWSGFLGDGNKSIEDCLLIVLLFLDCGLDETVVADALLTLLLLLAAFPFLIFLSSSVGLKLISPVITSAMYFRNTISIYPIIQTFPWKILHEQSNFP